MPVNLPGHELVSAGLADLALAPESKISESCAHKLVAGEVDRHVLHAPMIGPSTEAGP